MIGILQVCILEHLIIDTFQLVSRMSCHHMSFWDRVRGFRSGKGKNKERKGETAIHDTSSFTFFSSPAPRSSLCPGGSGPRYSCSVTPLACCLTWANLSTHWDGWNFRAWRHRLQLSQNLDQEVSLFLVGIWTSRFISPKSEVSETTGHSCDASNVSAAFGSV